MVLDMPPNVHGKKLWRSADFWLLFSILSMHINNVGSMSQAEYDEVKAVSSFKLQVHSMSREKNRNLIGARGFSLLE
ncbi:hypothetical protein B0H34DRAFT_735289 [Crassisporium funariophilum]|nr:hypothetical protein B0H34DRAFT_735289 [Crassisporium funariophilum]